MTVAHLFWREVATNAPALPFLPDWLYNLVFPQPTEGLSDLGRAAVEAMIDEGILVDITHMSARSIGDTLALFDRRDPDRRIPVIATHMACRFGGLEYTFTDETIGASPSVAACSGASSASTTSAAALAGSGPLRTRSGVVQAHRPHPRADRIV